jgi:hypothetical protein
MAGRDTDQELRGYERTDASVRPVIQFTIVLTLGLALVIALMVVLFNTLERIESRAEAAAHPMAVEADPPPPRLQTSNAVELVEHRAREAEVLGGYAWIDRDAGIVRIPIERALELVAERGLPVRR